MPGQYDAEGGFFLFETDQFSQWALMSKKIKTFSDISGHWAKSVIEGMATNGYISGMDEGKFAPDKSMTRAEVVTLLDRLLAGEGLSESPFADVPRNEWFAGSVNRMYAAGLVTGVDGKHFAPYETVTREQLAVMISHALSIKQDNTLERSGADFSLDLFADQSSISSWARGAVGLSVELGIVRGMAEGDHMIFAPQKAVTRAEAVIMLKKFLDKRK
jgi:S-layer homology domain